MKKHNIDSTKGTQMLIVKDNALINASYNLDLVEQRLILLAIVEARESGKGVSASAPLVVRAANYAETFFVERQAAYWALKSASENLFARQFSYQTLSEKGNLQQHRARWVSEVIYVEREACVKLIFSPAVVPLITRLEKHFTGYEMAEVAKLKSKYSTRLYELLIAWRSAGKTPVFELEDFRGKLGLGVNEYKNMSDFKKYVLELAVKQISTHSDLSVGYEQHKKGRAISGFSFTFKQKQKAVKPLPATRDPNTPDFFVNLTDAQRHLFAHRLAQLQEAGEHAEVGESTEDFAKRLAEMLLEPAHFRTFFPLLEQLGFRHEKNEVKTKKTAI